jgi:hypothetical protein
MKKALLVVVCTLFIATTAVASEEEIQLAQAIGGTGSATAGSGAAAQSSAATASSLQAANTIAFGTIAAAGLAVVAGADSASSH